MDRRKIKKLINRNIIMDMLSDREDGGHSQSHYKLLLKCRINLEYKKGGERFVVYFIFRGHIRHIWFTNTSMLNRYINIRI